MTSPIIRAADNHPLIAHIDFNSKDSVSRLGLFMDWQYAQGGNGYQPDLAGWRDALLAGSRDRDPLAPSSVSAYLSTVRGAYFRVANDNATRDALYRMTDSALSPSDRWVFVEEVLTRLRNAIRPGATPVKQPILQDRADSEQRRLTTPQANTLIDAPDYTTLKGIRDAAVIALLLCTGIREAELCALTVEDLRQKLGGELALRVVDGKGGKQRLIPYGDLSQCLIIVDHWLARVGISDGPVIRGLQGRSVRPTALTTRNVDRVLAAYPLVIAGDRVVIRPHDCRRSYAHLQYEAGMDLVAIQQNLGHTDIKTTLKYIGELDADRRRGRAFLAFAGAQELLTIGSREP